MSRRTRILAIVTVVALAAGGAAAAVAWVGRGGPQPAAAAQSGPRTGEPPLVLDVLVGNAGEAADLQSASSLYRKGQREAARAAFQRILENDSGSVYAQVGSVMAGWPHGTLAGLRELAVRHPGSGLVLLHEGLVLYWLRQNAAAAAAWRKAERVDPNSSAAIQAETFLHPDMPQGRPFFVPSRAVPQELADMLPLEELSALERRAKERRTAADWILYGVALQRVGRSVSALAAFERAAAIDPTSVEAKTAVAVARFTKDDPSRTFSRLGPLGKQYPHSAVVHFHLGLCLIWLRDLGDARKQLEAAKRDGAGTVYGREAQTLLAKLPASGGGS